MNWLYFFLLTAFVVHASDEEAPWSKPVNGLQARLLISPLKKGDDGRPHFVLLFQLQRKDQSAGLMKVFYSLGSGFNDGSSSVQLKVIDQNGKAVPQVWVAGNQFEFPWEPLVLPDDAFLSFRVGSSLWEGSGDNLGEHLEFNFWNQWKIPQSGSAPYYLTGTFTIPAKTSVPPSSDYIWRGMLLLPKVEIPRVPQDQPTLPPARPRRRPCRFPGTSPIPPPP